jgi:hypothetical protein
VKCHHPLPRFNRVNLGSPGDSLTGVLGGVRAVPGPVVELQKAKRAGSRDRGVSVDDPEFAIERALLGFDGVERHM